MYYMCILYFIWPSFLITFKNCCLRYSISIFKKNLISHWIVSECCLMPRKQLFRYIIMAGTSYISMRWWWNLLCTRPTLLSWIFNASSLNSSQVEMLLQKDTLSKFPAGLTNYCCMLSREVTNANFTALCVTRTGFESTI